MKIKYMYLLIILVLLGCSNNKVNNDTKVNKVINLKRDITKTELNEVIKKDKLGTVVVADYDKNKDANHVVENLVRNSDAKVYKLDKDTNNNKVVVNVIEDKEINKNIVLEDDLNIEAIKISNYITKLEVNKDDFILDEQDLKSVKSAINLKQLDNISDFNKSTKYFETLINKKVIVDDSPKYIEETASNYLKLINNGFNQYNYFNSFKQNEDGLNYKVNKVPDSKNDPNAEVFYNLEFLDNSGNSILFLKKEKKSVRCDFYDKDDSQFAYIVDHNMERVSHVYIIDKLNNKTFLTNQLSFINDDRAYIQYNNFFGAYDFNDKTFYPLVKLSDVELSYNQKESKYTGTDLAFMGFDNAKLQITPNTLLYYPSIDFDGSEKLTVEFNINDITTYKENKGINISKNY